MEPSRPGAGEDGASGGGPSVYWPQPAYQKGVVPTSLGTTRSAPDIAADADPFTGINVGMLNFSGKQPTFFEESIGGTSESSPLVAGMVTAAQQGQEPSFGFINPVIYKLNRTSAFYDTLPLTSRSPALYRGSSGICASWVRHPGGHGRAAQGGAGRLTHGWAGRAGGPVRPGQRGAACGGQGRACDGGRRPRA